MAILDRFQLKQKPANILCKKKLNTLAMVSFTLAAKIHESGDLTYSFVNNLFSEESKIPLADLAEMQRDVLITFGFDFEFPCVQPFIECYLSIILDQRSEKENKRIVPLCQFLVKLTLLNVKFIGYKPSSLAEYVIILAMDLAIYNLDMLESLSEMELE